MDPARGGGGDAGKSNRGARKDVRPRRWRAAHHASSVAAAWIGPRDVHVPWPAALDVHGRKQPTLDLRTRPLHGASNERRRVHHSNPRGQVDAGPLQASASVLGRRRHVRAPDRGLAGNRGERPVNDADEECATMDADDDETRDLDSTVSPCWLTRPSAWIWRHTPAGHAQQPSVESRICSRRQSRRRQARSSPTMRAPKHRTIDCQARGNAQAHSVSAIVRAGHADHALCIVPSWCSGGGHKVRDVRRSIRSSP